ncbi:MAG: hypothetical protein Q7T79_02350 [bacterium]|nr:hypothetical protein [bacterium]
MQIFKYKKFYKIILSLIILFNVAFLAPVMCVNASELALNLTDAFKFKNNSNTDPTDSVAKNAGYNTAKTVSLLAVITTVINVVLSLLGVIFLILIIFAGFNWMTAAGEEEKITKAKSTITAAIIGLIVVLSAYAISYFVIFQISTATLNGTVAK